MPTLREVRRRIGGVQKTQKITRAMKMVAAAKLRRAQVRLLAARPYARAMKKLLDDIAGAPEVRSAELIAPREVKSALVVVVTSDRGFCGAFNASLIRSAQAHIASFPPGVRVRLIPLGKKGTDFFARRGYDLAGRYPGIFAGLSPAAARGLAAEIMASYRRGECDRVEIIYNEFKSVAQQRILIEQFLPVPCPPSTPPGGGRGAQAGDYIYEPGREVILQAMLPRLLNFQIWRILLESGTAEEGARMAAMENATENAREMIDTLQLQYNKARQAAITKELLEVVSGAEALRDAT